MTNMYKAAKVFMCHSSSDKKFVRKLSQDLFALSIKVWYDDWELQPGDSLHGCIARAIDESTFMAVVLSPNSVQSKWCERELEAALAKEIETGAKFVVPILYRRVQPPRFLADRVFIDFGDSYYPSLVRLAGFIHKAEPRALAERLSEYPIRTFQEAAALLAQFGVRNATEMKPDHYRDVTRVFSLWDFGGNPDYRLFHVVLIDPETGKEKSRMKFTAPGISETLNSTQSDSDDDPGSKAI